MVVLEDEEELMIRVEEHVYDRLQLVDRLCLELYEKLIQLDERFSETDKRLFFLEIDKR